jgi:hypothetical protein
MLSVAVCVLVGFSLLPFPFLVAHMLPHQPLNWANMGAVVSMLDA